MLNGPPIPQPGPPRGGGWSGGEKNSEKKLVSLDSELSKTFENLVFKKLKFVSIFDFSPPSKSVFVGS